MFYDLAFKGNDPVAKAQALQKAVMMLPSGEQIFSVSSPSSHLGCALTNHTME